MLRTLNDKVVEGAFLDTPKLGHSKKLKRGLPEYLYSTENACLNR